MHFFKSVFKYIRIYIILLFVILSVACYQNCIPVVIEEKFDKDTTFVQKNRNRKRCSIGIL